MSTETKATDPISSIADSLEEASEHIEFAEALETDKSHAAEILEKTAYSTFYYFSYGVCFAGFLAGKLIPKEGLVAQGLQDGADAAKEAVDRISSHDDDEFSDFEEAAPAPKPAKVEKPTPKKTAAASKSKASASKASAASKSTTPKSTRSAKPKSTAAKSTTKSE